MLMERITKETTDITRAVMDMAWWLDAGETLSSIVSQKIIQGTTGWSEAPYPPPGSAYPYDATPLTQTASLAAVGTQVVAFVSVGSPGLVYTCQYVVRSTLGRQITIELGVQVSGVPIGASGYGPIPSYLAVTISDGPPSNPQCGQLWWDSSSPELYIYYCEPTSSEWVIVTGNYGAIPSDALLDGRVYGRQSGTWVDITSPAAGVFPMVRTNGAGGPTWSGGPGAPSSTQPVGSMYSRTDGGAGSTLYVSRGAGTWVAVAGV